MEDEYNFLHKCTKYLSQRQALDLKRHVNDFYLNIRNLDATLRLIYLLSARTDVAKCVATSIYDAFCMRASVV